VAAGTVAAAGTAAVVQTKEEIAVWIGAAQAATLTVGEACAACVYCLIIYVCMCIV
jgi:hypothetical protein